MKRFLPFWQPARHLAELWRHLGPGPMLRRKIGCIALSLAGASCSMAAIGTAHPLAAAISVSVFPAEQVSEPATRLGKPGAPPLSQPWIFCDRGVPAACACFLAQKRSGMLSAAWPQDHPDAEMDFIYEDADWISPTRSSYIDLDALDLKRQLAFSKNARCPFRSFCVGVAPAATTAAAHPVQHTNHSRKPWECRQGTGFSTISLT